jgi:hypothetical protein
LPRFHVSDLHHQLRNHLSHTRHVLNFLPTSLCKQVSHLNQFSLLRRNPYHLFCVRIFKTRNSSSQRISIALVLLHLALYIDSLSILSHKVALRPFEQRLDVMRPSILLVRRSQREHIALERGELKALIVPLLR